MLGSPAWAAAAGAPPLAPPHAARLLQLEAEGCTVLLLCLGAAPEALRGAAPPPLGADDEPAPLEEEFEEEGVVTPLAAAAAAGGAAALIALADGIKPDAAAGCAALRAMGLRCIMLTGDNPRAAARVAAAVGISPADCHAALLPAGKLAALAVLRAAGERVAMVGDGVNDAPALAAADVGIAIGAGAEVAIDAAGVVLVHSRVCDVAATVSLARAAMRRIRLNLLFSLGFNALGLPIAAGALYPALRVRLPPEAAAAAMACSSVAVVLSSLSLRRFKSPHFSNDAPLAESADAGAAAGAADQPLERVRGFPASELTHVSRRSGDAL
jgi:Cu+-exporting ATPase